MLKMKQPSEFIKEIQVVKLQKMEDFRGLNISAQFDRRIES